MTTETNLWHNADPTAGQIAELLDKLNQGIDFTVDMAPVVVQQALAYSLYVSLVWLVILGFVIATYWAGVWRHRRGLIDRKEIMTSYEYAVSLANLETLCWAGGAVSFLLSISMAILAANVFQILVTPEYWIFNWAMGRV